jgi:tellurite resistance protein
LRDLCVIARADGTVAEPERELLLDLAHECEVPAAVIEQALSQVVQLD